MEAEFVKSKAVMATSLGQKGGQTGKRQGYLSWKQRRAGTQKNHVGLYTKQNKTKHHKHVPKTNKQTNKQQNKLVAAGLGKGLL